MTDTSELETLRADKQRLIEDNIILRRSYEERLAQATAGTSIGHEERNLALARLAIFRKRLDKALAEKVVREDQEWRTLIQGIVDSDAKSRTRSLEELMNEAAT